MKYENVFKVLFAAVIWLVLLALIIAWVNLCCSNTVETNITYTTFYNAGKLDYIQFDDTVYDNIYCDGWDDTDHNNHHCVLSHSNSVLFQTAIDLGINPNLMPYF